MRTESCTSLLVRKARRSVGRGVGRCVVTASRGLGWALIAGNLALSPTSLEGQESPGSFLEAFVVAAESHELFLVLRVEGGTVDLCIDGVILESFPWTAGRVAGAALPAVGYRLTTALEEPDRPFLQPTEEGGPGAAARAVQIATWQEERLAGAPESFELEFEPALRLRIRPRLESTGAPGHLLDLGRALLEGWRDLLSRRGEEEHVPLIELELDPDAARRLYRTLSPELLLLVETSS